MGDRRCRGEAVGGVDHDRLRIAGENLEGGRPGGFAEGVGVPAQEHGTLDAPGTSIVDDCLGHRRDVRLVEGAIQAAPAMAGGSERDPLVALGRVGTDGVVRRDEMGDVDEIVWLGCGSGTGMGHGFPLKSRRAYGAERGCIHAVTASVRALIAAALVVVAIAAFVVGRGVDTADGWMNRIFGEGEVTNVGPVTITALRELAQLTTFEMVEYTVVEKADDRGWLNWATGDRVSMFVVARIGAGVDLSVLTEGSVDADPETGVVEIRLPSPALTYVDVDEEQTTVYDRDTGLFTSGNPNLEQSARLAAEEVLVDAALERGLLERAAEEARVVITAFVESLGYTDIEVVVGS